MGRDTELNFGDKIQIALLGAANLFLAALSVYFFIKLIEKLDV